MLDRRAHSAGRSRVSNAFAVDRHGRVVAHDGIRTRTAKRASGDDGSTWIVIAPS